MGWKDAPVVDSQLTRKPSAWESAPVVGESKQKTPTLDEANTAAVHLARHGSFGLGDKIIAAEQAISDKWHDKTGKVTLGSAYDNNLKFLDKTMEASDKENPKARWLGNIGGIALSAGVGAGVNALRGAGAAVQATPMALGQLAKESAKQGSAYGAVGGYANDRSDSMLETAANTLFGGGLGGLLGYATPHVTQFVGDKIVTPFSEMLRGFSGRKALNALGAMKPELNELGSDRARELGISSMEKGVVTPFASRATMASRAQAGREAGGQKIGGALSELDAVALPDEKIFPVDAADRVLRAAEELDKRPALRGIADKFRKEAGNIAEKGDTPMSLTQYEDEIARDYKTLANWSDTATLPKKTLRKLPMALEDHAETVAKGIADRTGKTDSFGRYLSGKKEFGTMKELGEIAQKGLKRQASNHSFGLKDLLAAGAGTAGFGPLGGIAMLGGSKLLNRYGDQMSATAAHSFSKMLRSLSPELVPMVARMAPQSSAEVGGALSPSISMRLLPMLEPAFAEEDEETMRTRMLAEALRRR